MADHPISNCSHHVPICAGKDMIFFFQAVFGPHMSGAQTARVGLDTTRSYSSKRRSRTHARMPPNASRTAFTPMEQSRSNSIWRHSAQRSLLSKRSVHICARHLSQVTAHHPSHSVGRCSPLDRPRWPSPRVPNGEVSGFGDEINHAPSNTSSPAWRTSPESELICRN